MVSAQVLRRSAARGAALGLVLALAAVSVSAAEAFPPSPPGLLRIAEKPPFVPGQVVHLSWDSLPPEVEEFEILLVAELPAPLRVRLTESEEASCRSLAVAIPALPSCSARFLLRAGSPRGEFPFGRSEPWRLETPPRSAVQRLRERKGELWLSPDLPRNAGLESRNHPQADAPAFPPPTVPSVGWRVLSAGSSPTPPRGRVPAPRASASAPASPSRPAPYPLRI